MVTDFLNINMHTHTLSVLISFCFWQGFELKVYAQDKDDSVFDHVDDLIDYVLFTYNATPAANSSTVEWQNFTAYGERLSGAAS